MNDSNKNKGPGKDPIAEHLMDRAATLVAESEEGIKNLKPIEGRGANETEPQTENPLTLGEV